MFLLLAMEMVLMTIIEYIKNMPEAHKIVLAPSSVSMAAGFSYMLRGCVRDGEARGGG